MGKLDGKVALITGGARGQGRSHALTLAREGADIVVCDVAKQLPTVPYGLATEDQLSETTRLVEDLDRRCVAVKADVSNAAEMKGVVDRAVSEFGKIDILVANAGISSGGVPAWELTEEQWDEMLQVNLKGMWLATKYVIPVMLRQGSGAITMTSSATVAGFPNLAHYVSAKAGIIGLMRVLANELGRHGIRVNAVLPTTVDTDMVNNQFTYDMFAGGSGGTRENLIQGMAAANLLPTALVEAQDISNAILWLVSDDARWVTGVALPVDAGMLVKV